jgi:hypothetical protein
VALNNWSKKMGNRSAKFFVLLILCLFAAMWIDSATAEDWDAELYLDIKASYKYDEPDYFEHYQPDGSMEKISADWGHEMANQISIGISTTCYESKNWIHRCYGEWNHRSHLLSGRPFNDDPEYRVNEIQVGYRMALKLRWRK